MRKSEGFGVQMIIMGVIAVLVIVTLFILSGVIRVGKFSGGATAVPLTMWGPFPLGSISKIIDKVGHDNKDVLTLSYVQKPVASYEQNFIDALASGQGPSIIVITQDLILKHKDKFYSVPFASFSERTFRDTFLDEGELYLTKDGVLAIPFAIDPIVLYRNTDLFSKAGLAGAPKYWDDFTNYVQALREIDVSGNVIQAGAAMGEFSNIEHAKEIYSLLILQSGNSIINKSDTSLTFGLKSSLPEEPAESALRFFTAFSNPTKVTYTWNRGLPNSKDDFIAGKLAMYFGYASEFDDIKNKNPHLNFDVSLVPQIRNGSVQATFGRLYALAIPKISQNISVAIQAMYGFVTPDVLNMLRDNLKLPPVNRALLAQGSLDPVMAVFYKAAIQARAWLEPDPKRVSEIFQNMIESVTVGRKSTGEAIATARALLGAELSKLKR